VLGDAPTSSVDEATSRRSSGNGSERGWSTSSILSNRQASGPTYAARSGRMRCATRTDRPVTRHPRMRPEAHQPRLTSTATC
jgi:hypothetical protein